MSSQVAIDQAIKAKRDAKRTAKNDQQHLESRSGRLVLVLVYVTLLGGSFTLDRASSSLPAIDLRLLGLGVSTFAYVIFTPALKSRRGRVFPGLGAFMFLLWSAWLAFSSIWAGTYARVDSHLLDLAVMAALVVLGMMAAVQIPRSELTVIWTLLLWTGIIYFLAAIATGPGDQGRYSAFGGGPNVFVRVMLLATLAALFRAMTNQVRALWLLPLFMVGAFLSGSRGGLLAFLLVALIGGLPLLKRLPKRSLLVVLAGGVVAFVAAPGLAKQLMSTIDSRFIDQTFEQRYDSGRGAITSYTLQIFDDNLFIGAGLDSFWNEVGSSVGFEYPHNLVLATAADAGLVGLLLFFGSIFVLLRSAFQKRPMSTNTLLLALAGVFVLVTALFSGDYYDSRFMWFFLGLAAVDGRPVTGGEPHSREIRPS